MKIKVLDTKMEAAQFTAWQMHHHLKNFPGSSIGLATGATMLPVYESFIQLHLEEKLQLEKSSFFMLDEYVGLDKNHPENFRNYIRRNFQIPLNLKEEAFFSPYDSSSENIDESIERYDLAIKSIHGLSFQLLGIRQNGHIGFNEPGSKIDSTTRKVVLTESTRTANKAQFPNEEVPTMAITTGLSNILKAKKIVLLATGVSKAMAVQKLTEKVWDTNWPATCLGHHLDFLLVLDREAASKLK